MNLPIYYRKAPVILQNMFVSLKGWHIQKKRFNKNFKQLLETFEQSNPNEINLDRLRYFLLQASYTPFWRDRFKDYGINIKALNLEQEIKRLPILTKDEVKDNVDKIINPRLSKRKLHRIQTSGTTGSGLIFYQTRLMENAQWAVWWRYRRRLGINLNDWCGWFGGTRIIGNEVDQPPFWRTNWPGRQIMFSLHHLNPNTVEYYYNKLRSSHIKWIHGYPSQITFLGSLIIEKGFAPLKLKFVTTGSENLLFYQKSIIETAFGVKPINHYGLAEGVANISEFNPDLWQVDRDFAICEFVDMGLGNTKKIIGTNYYNDAFPLIRYDTNDLVSLSEKGEIQSIDGREEDYIVLKSGQKITRISRIFQKAIFVREAQVYQPKIGRLILRIVKGERYEQAKHEEFLEREIKDLLGDDVEVVFEYLNQIPRTRSGKLKFVISDIK